MCGIIAVTGNNIGNIREADVQNMLGTLSRRGPDEKGFVRLNDCILGQTRLSIVDMSGGRQPMKDGNGPYTIVFNGEIYGYKEVRKNLESLGYEFLTQSDTEVILKSYAEYGEKCVERLDGMFAFALWDEKKKQLFIARDRFGKKPFYYAVIGETFMAASEMKAIFASGLIKGKIDSQAVDDFLQFMYVPPDKTIYSNIQTLPPAHAGIVKNGRLETWKYWRLEKNEIKISYGDAKDEIKRLFNESVRKRMVADVEIGSLLSGGVDSTLVTAYAANYSGKPIKTFTVGYGKHINELPYAKQASDRLKTDHYTLTADSFDINELRNVIEYFDEPHADSSDFPQHLISELTSSKVKVALSGDGADELFMGYGWYQKYWNTPVYRRIFSDPYAIYRKMIGVFDRSERRDLLKNHRNGSGQGINAHVKKGPSSEHSTPFQKINDFDLKQYLPGQLLVKVDRTSMMHSLEIRSPFLDTALAEFVYNIPLNFKLDRTRNKIILKEILTEIMPRKFVERRKQGFGAPILEWIKSDAMQSEIMRIVGNSSHPMFDYLDKKTVQQILSPQSAVNKSSAQKIWSLLCLAIWFETHSQYHAE